MTTATAAIIETLNETFAALDAKMVVDQKSWAKGRVEAIKEYKAIHFAKPVSVRLAEQHKYYAGLFATAGGKAWYNVFNGRNEAMINEFVEKNCRATSDKRNALIARKLNEAGISAVTGSEVIFGANGFTGTFKVETDKGSRVVTIQTIYAGGYNIQCFHQRTLVKVR